MSNVPTGITAYRNQGNGEITGSYPRPEMQRMQELQEANAILAQQAADWYVLYSRAMKERSADARDAARYRWLRHNSGYWIRCHLFGNVWGHEHKDADLDGLIDEQMRVDFGPQEQKPRFENVSCSQCGRDFGPGDHGFSHCENHKMTREG